MKKRIFLASLSLISIVGLASCNNNNVEEKSQSEVSSSEELESSTSSTDSITYEDILKDNIYSGNYYDSIDTIEGDKLKSELNTLLNNGFKQISYSEATSTLKNIDSYDSNYVECLYSGLRLDPSNSGSAAGQWNKEHIWAKTYGFNDPKYNAYSDIQMLRVTESSINSARSDKYFNNVSGIKTNGNSWNESEFEVRDEVKGDVARIMFYMTVMYDSSTLDLELTDDLTKINASHGQLGGTQYLGKLSVLLKWASEDPVDQREISRNEKAYSYQKNRNPFIDHPEYAYYIFKNECDSLSLSLESFKNNNQYVAANNDAINYVNGLVNSIGTVTLESESNIKEVEEKYNKLGNVTQSFFTGYETLQNKIYELNALKDLANRDTTVGTSVDFTSVSSKDGSITTNGVKNDYTASMFYQGKGIYAQTSKAITINVSNLYAQIKSVSIYISGNNNQTSNITISDGTNSVKQEVKSLTSSGKKVDLDISGLDLSKKLTITITNETGKSVIVSKISYNI